MSSKPEAWGPRLTRSIAAEIKVRRKALGWSAQELSDAMGKLGVDFPRSTLADLESGRRNQVSVAELLAIAAALNVPPVLLISPVGASAETEIVPGNRVAAFRAVQWISGETPIPHADDEAYITSITDDWHAATGNPLPLLRARARAVSEETRALDRARGLEASALLAGTPGEREALAEAAAARREVAEARRDEAEKYRAQAAALGMLPPE
jgi:transcriptional regulator with XRE-family HTH domain